jgi:hypothetical protein
VDLELEVELPPVEGQLSGRRIERLPESDWRSEDEEERERSTDEEGLCRYSRTVRVLLPVRGEYSRREGSVTGRVDRGFEERTDEELRPSRLRLLWDG